MLGDILEDVLLKYPKVIVDFEYSKLSYLIKELIIMEIVCLEGKETDSKEIQDVFIQILSKSNIPQSLKEESKSATGKSKLKVLLNNILSSNLFHSNGLYNRRELYIRKNTSKYVYSASPDIMDDINRLFETNGEIVNIFEMGVFLRKYNYLPLLLKFFNIKTDYCQLNSNHIKRSAIFPVFRNLKGSQRSSLLNIVHICDKCIIDFINEDISRYEERKY